MTDKEMIKEMRNQLGGLIKEYVKAKGIYDNAGLNAELKADALNTMASVLQLEGVAINNIANFNHALSLAKGTTKSEN
jgi:hypothetical protein